MPRDLHNVPGLLPHVELLELCAILTMPGRKISSALFLNLPHRNSTTLHQQLITLDNSITFNVEPPKQYEQCVSLHNYIITVLGKKCPF